MDDRSARFEDKIKNARSRSTQQQQKLRRTKTADSVLTTTQKGESSGQRRRRKSDKKTDILSIMSSSCSSMTTGTPTTAPTTKKDRMDTDEIIKMLEDYASNNNAEALQAFHSLKMGPDEGLRLQQQQRQRSTRRLLSPPKHANTSGAKTAWFRAGKPAQSNSHNKVTLLESYQYHKVTILIASGSIHTSKHTC